MAPRRSEDALETFSPRAPANIDMANRVDAPTRFPGSRRRPRIADLGPDDEESGRRRQHSQPLHPSGDGATSLARR
jgi:hypothetical protein